jgi:hypothetical protein
MARRMRMTVMCVEQDDWSCHGPRADFAGGGAGQAKGSAAQYQTVAEAYRDLERAGGPAGADRPSRCPAGPDPGRDAAHGLLLVPGPDRPGVRWSGPRPGREARRPCGRHRDRPADVWFEPGLVLEILSAELTLSPNYTAGLGQVKEQAGLAMRFPRFTGRWRDDKAAQDDTTTGELTGLYRTAQRKPAGT